METARAGGKARFLRSGVGGKRLTLPSSLPDGVELHVGVINTLHASLLIHPEVNLLQFGCDDEMAQGLFLPANLCRIGARILDNQTSRQRFLWDECRKGLLAGPAAQAF